MNKYDPNEQELDALLREVDALLEEPEEPVSDWDIDVFQPEDTFEPEEPVFYQNYSNDYGRQMPDGFQQQPDPMKPTISAYNADFRPSRRKERPPEPVRIDYAPVEPTPQPKKQKPPRPPKKRRGCGCGCLTLLLVPVVAVLLVFALVFQMPQSPHSIGDRKRDTATVLLCGTDESGLRTDTMMLLYLSGGEHKVGLLSLPRDTYTIATAGYAAKLNSAYGRNNCGEEGMVALLDYVADIIGYHPDGYILVDFTIVPQIVDLMGGLEVEVPVDIEVGHISLSQGLQQLNGEEVLTLLRHRSSYAMADLTRVEVQRSVIKACMDQWISPNHLPKLSDALDLIERNSLSSLSTRNYLWMGKTILLGLGNGFSTQTLPGYADYIDGVSYYLLDADAVAEMINTDFNPYRVTIEVDDLNIAG